MLGIQAECYMQLESARWDKNSRSTYPLHRSKGSHNDTYKGSARSNRQFLSCRLNFFQEQRSAGEARNAPLATGAPSHVREQRNLRSIV
jgi:hypothetical protein